MQGQAAAAPCSNHSKPSCTIPCMVYTPHAPLPLLPAELVTWQAGLHHVGIEGFTMHFRHTPYGGHHKVRGW